MTVMRRRCFRATAFNISRKDVASTLQAQQTSEIHSGTQLIRRSSEEKGFLHPIPPHLISTNWNTEPLGQDVADLIRDYARDFGTPSIAGLCLANEAGFHIFTA